MAGNTIKGITIELDGSTVKLGKALKSILGESKSLEKQLKDVNKALQLDPHNTDLLATKQRLLGDQIENTARHLDALRQAEAKAADSVKNFDAWEAAYLPIQEEIDKTKKKLTELSAQQKKMERVGDIDSSAYRDLSSEIEELKTNLKDLHSQGEEVTKQFGEPIPTREYEKLQTEITLTEAKLRAAQKEADEVSDHLRKIDSGEITDVANAAKDAENALDGAGKEAADFGDVLKANVIADGARAIAESMADVVEETREYQKIMGSLEMSSQYNGYSADQTREAYERLYGVLRDDQSAATTLSNLQALQLEQADLMNVVDACIGGWALYGDSIPIDSLAESINETVKAGQVTGTFADILNWAGMSEEFFNKQLASCANEHERLKLVMSALSQQELPAVGQLWRENNKVLVENNEANARLQEQIGSLGETLMPIATMLTEMLTKALSWFNGLDEGTQKFIVGAVLIAGVLTPILSIGKTLLGGLGSFMGITGGMPALLSGVTGGFTGMSAAMGALPVLGIVAGITTIGGCLLWLANNADSVKAIVSDSWNSVVSDYQLGNEMILTETHAAHAAQVTATQDMFSNLGATYRAGNNAIVTETHAAHVAQVSLAQSTMASLKSSISAGLSGLVSSFTSYFQNILSSATNWGTNMRSKASSMIDSVRSAISSGLDRIKNLFNFSWSLPHIRLPHFYISGSFSLNPPSVPDFGVQWYAKGGILNGAQIFGSMGDDWLGGGEAGPEAVLPLSGFYSELRGILASFMAPQMEHMDLSGLYSRLDGIYDRLARLQIVLDTGTLVGETIDRFDAAFAERQLLEERGV